MTNYGNELNGGELSARRDNGQITLFNTQVKPIIFGIFIKL